MIIEKRLVVGTGKYYATKNKCKYITIHETDNNRRTANARNHGVLLARGDFNASWHYTVDEHRIEQHFNDNVSCWHGSTYVANTESIAIELCVNEGSDFKKTVSNASELIKHLMRKHNIPITRVVQHNKWNGKNCPRRLRKGSHGVKWIDLINSLGGVKVTQKPSSVSSNAIDKLVQDTLLGRYGNGATRKKLLGSNYNEVQKRINAMYKNN